MSSLRNAAKRVTHKERGQPAARRRLGFLEKHKDYVVRARDFQRKEKIISNLRNKAENRNPDEFYFNMNKSQMVNGKHRMEDEETIDAEDMLLYKTQDLNYVHHRRAVDEKKIDRLRNNLHFTTDGEGGKKRNHTIFVEDGEDVDAVVVAEEQKLEAASSSKKKKPRLSEDELQSEPTTTSRSVLSAEIHKSAREATVALAQESKLPRSLKKKMASKSEKSYAELAAREQRSERLKKTAEYLQLQKSLLGKGSKKKMEVVVTDKKSGKISTRTVYKWKRERAR